jgi:hypothetical protein
MIKPMKNPAIDNEEFLSIWDQLGDNLSLTNYDFPTSVDNNFITFGAWKFNLSRVIHPLAMLPEVLEGWNELIGKGIPVDVLFVCLFLRTLLDSSGREVVEEEPELCALLRLCYWIQSCTKIPDTKGFANKLAEIKLRLGVGVKTNIKSLEIPLKEEFSPNDEQYYEELQSILQAIRKRRAPAGFTQSLHDIRNSIYGYVSECMFYRIAHDAGFDIRFPKRRIDKNPDIFINGFAAEIKTLIDSLEFQEKIEPSLVEEVMLSLIRSKSRAKINEALEQNANIVILDATGTSIGNAINLWASKNNKTFSAQKAIENAIKLAESDLAYIPVLCFAQAYDLQCNYKFSMIVVPGRVKT